MDSKARVVYCVKASPTTWQHGTPVVVVVVVCDGVGVGVSSTSRTTLGSGHKTGAALRLYHSLGKVMFSIQFSLV